MIVLYFVIKAGTICSLLSEENIFFRFLVSYINFSTNVPSMNSRTNQHLKYAEPAVLIVFNQFTYISSDVFIILPFQSTTNVIF